MAYNRLNMETATIEELEDECEKVQGTNFGHNMIRIICNVVEERFGEDEADRFFDTYQH